MTYPEHFRFGHQNTQPSSSMMMFKPINHMNQQQQQPQQQYQEMNLTMDEDDYSDNEELNNIKDSNDLSPNSKKRSRGPIQNGIRRSPNKWTKEENTRLFELVHMYGEKKWKRISAEMGSQKTGAQCAQHWKRVLSPDIRKGPWDEDEEELLLRLVQQHGSSWKKIAKRICKRTDIQCRYQYLKALQSREVPWHIKEDESLKRKVQEMDQVSWLEVSEHLAKLKHTNTLRTALECKCRYIELADGHVPVFKQLTPIIDTLPTMSMSSRSLLTNSSSSTISSPSSPLSSGPSSPLIPLAPITNSSYLTKQQQRITISNLTSPSSSPSISPPSSPTCFSNNNNSINNNSNNNNNNDIFNFSSSNNNMIPSLKSTLLNSQHSINNKSNNQSSFDLLKLGNQHQHIDKKVKSNGEYVYSQHSMKHLLSDQTSDDDSTIPNPISMFVSYKNNNNSSSSSSSSSTPSSRNSTPTNNQSPVSSPLALPANAFDKLRSHSFDFFNLESLAAIASSRPRERHDNFNQLQVN